MKYIPLNIKTEYDLMNSLIKIDELILYAKNNNINTLGITDTEMFGSFEFITKCQKNNIKPIIGTELNINEINFFLYAQNYNGFKSLCKIISKKNLEELNLDYIFKMTDDIICVCDYKDYETFKNKFTYTFIKYKNDIEKTNALLITNDIVYFNEIRYYEKNDIYYFKYLKYIEEQKTIDENIDIKETYFEEVTDNFDITSTIKFSNLINLEFPKSTLHIPVYKENSKEFLRALAKKGLEKRLNNNVPDHYKKRLTYELDVIEKMNYVDYFLIVYDFILFSKKNNILVGPGRGSGAASLVNYSLGIINIDPLKYDLIFERFLNPDRITMPDIDIDFDSLKREEVIEYVTNKYGINNTARIISFNTLLPKQVIRDVSKVLNMNTVLVDKICKTIKDEKDFNLLKENKEFINIINRNNESKELIKICNKLCGIKKNTSIHAAGVVISDIPLYNLMPLYKSNDVILTGYDKDHIEELGLLKMDFLSIKNLNTISNILEEIKNDNINLNIDNIDLNDKKTLDLFKNGYTNGIFQFESDGMKSFLKKLEEDNFNTLVDAIALYRPGPRDMIDEYILRKKGKKKITYLIPELESILKSTYGIIIYQEQVLEILRKVGNYTYAEADLIRRAMSKKKADIIEQTKSKFTSSVMSKGYTESVSLELFELILKFSSYGFNKSHSVVYSLVAFQMAYLKINYTKYFMKNLLNMNKSNNKIKEYIDEAKLLGIEFSLIDINNSCKEFVIKNNKLVFPFSLIKSIGVNVSNEIEEERNKKKFDSFYDFVIRCYGKGINKKVIVSLIECGSFNQFNINKKTYIQNIDEIINYADLCKDLSITLIEKPVFEEIDDFTDKEQITNEIKNYGFYLSFHPVTKYNRENLITLNNINNYFNRTVTSILYVEDVKTIKTKNNEKMSFVKFSDEYSQIEGILFPNEYKKIGELEVNSVYKVIGKIEKRNNTLQFIIYSTTNLDN